MSDKIIFISDLHLSKSDPKIEEAFLKLLDKIKSNTTQLYILGDWFDFWIRDSINIPEYSNLIEALVTANNSGLEILFMPGNRDFLLGKKFFNASKVKLILDPYKIKLADKKVLLTHGDKLCTDDESYQKFMKIVQNPITKFIFKNMPKRLSKNIVKLVRRKTGEIKITKENNIMDVNHTAINTIMTDVDILIHGHTHRPQVHKHNDKARYVLSDWSKTPQIIIFKNNKLTLEKLVL